MPTGHEDGRVARGVEDGRLGLEPAPRQSDPRPVGREPHLAASFVDETESRARMAKPVEVVGSAGPDDIGAVERFVVDSERCFTNGERAALDNGEDGGAPTQRHGRDPRSHLAVQSIEVEDIADILSPAGDLRARPRLHERSGDEDEPARPGVTFERA